MWRAPLTLEAAVRAAPRLLGFLAVFGPRLGVMLANRRYLEHTVCERSIYGSSSVSLRCPTRWSVQRTVKGGLV